MLFIPLPNAQKSTDELKAADQRLSLLVKRLRGKGVDCCLEEKYR